MIGEEDELCGCLTRFNLIQLISFRSLENVRNGNNIKIALMPIDMESENSDARKYHTHVVLFLNTEIIQ